MRSHPAITLAHHPIAELIFLDLSVEVAPFIMSKFIKICVNGELLDWWHVLLLGNLLFQFLVHCEILVSPFRGKMIVNYLLWVNHFSPTLNRDLFECNNDGHY